MKIIKNVFFELMKIIICFIAGYSTACALAIFTEHDDPGASSRIFGAVWKKEVIY